MPFCHAENILTSTDVDIFLQLFLLQQSNCQVFFILLVIKFIWPGLYCLEVYFHHGIKKLKR